MLILSLSATACGFHLRGATETLAQSFPDIDLACDRKSEFRLCQDLSTRIIALGSRINDDAAYQLSITRLESSQRAFTLEADASAAEYELQHRFRYALKDKKQDKIIAGRVIERQQIYRYNASALIAKDREQDNVSKQLDDAILETLLREISLIHLNDTGSTP